MRSTKHSTKRSKRHSTKRSKKHSTKRSKKHSTKRSKKHSTKRSKKQQKKGNITYSPKKHKFVLSHSISRHQRNIFLGNTLHHTLAKFTPVSSCNGLCTDKI
jgi:hypothetical protein